MEKLYKIEITEILQRVIEIKAKNSEEAFKKVKEKYQNEEIVLAENDFVEVEFVETNQQKQK